MAWPGRVSAQGMGPCIHQRICRAFVSGCQPGTCAGRVTSRASILDSANSGMCRFESGPVHWGVCVLAVIANPANRYNRPPAGSDIPAPGDESVWCRHSTEWPRKTGGGFDSCGLHWRPRGRLSAPALRDGRGLKLLHLRPGGLPALHSRRHHRVTQLCVRARFPASALGFGPGSERRNCDLPAFRAAAVTVVLQMDAPGASAPGFSSLLARA